MKSEDNLSDQEKIGIEEAGLRIELALLEQGDYEKVEPSIEEKGVPDRIIEIKQRLSDIDLESKKLS